MKLAVVDPKTKEQVGELEVNGSTFSFVRKSPPAPSILAAPSGNKATRAKKAKKAKSVSGMQEKFSFPKRASSYPVLLKTVLGLPHPEKGGLDDPRNLPEGQQLLLGKDKGRIHVRFQELAYVARGKKYTSLGALFDSNVQIHWRRNKRDPDSGERRSGYGFLATNTDLSDWDQAYRPRDEVELKECLRLGLGWKTNVRLLPNPGKGRTSTPLVAYYKEDPKKRFVGVITHWRNRASRELVGGTPRGKTSDVWFFYVAFVGGDSLLMPHPASSGGKPWTERTLRAMLKRANAYFKRLK